MAHKKEEGTYHCNEKYLDSSAQERQGLPLLLIPEYSGINKGQRVLTDQKQHTGNLLLNAS